MSKMASEIFLFGLKCIASMESQTICQVIREILFDNFLNSFTENTIYQQYETVTNCCTYTSNPISKYSFLLPWKY